MDEFIRPYLLCGENLRPEESAALAGIFRTVLLPPFSKLGAGVRTHADTLFSDAGEYLVTFSEYYKENEELFSFIAETGKKLILTDEPVGDKYPDDVLLNGLFLSEVLYGRTDRLSKLLTGPAGKCEYVRQGYTRCSVLKVSENAAVTSDRGIASALVKNGIDVLKISEGNILLDGFPYGFIGGASFTYENTVYFFGDLAGHPDHEAISDFISRHGRDTVSLSALPLHDIGGGIVIK